MPLGWLWVGPSTATHNPCPPDCTADHEGNAMPYDGSLWRTGTWPAPPRIGRPDRGNRAQVKASRKARRNR
jgi:hypothetical protein